MAAARLYRPGGGGKVRVECAAVRSFALIVGGLGLAHVDRHLVPANMTNWDVSDVFGGRGEHGHPGDGSRPCFPAAAEPDRLAGARGGPDARAEQLHKPVRAARAGRGAGSLPAGPAARWASAWIWPIPLAMVAFMFLLFPTGRLRSRRWRPAAWLSRRLLWRNNRQGPIPPGPLRPIKGKYSEVLWSGCE
jgi:hypothetical protein